MAPRHKSSEMGAPSIPDSMHSGLWDPGLDYNHYPSVENNDLLYRRAQSLCRSSGIKADDVLHLTPKFWNMTLSYASIRDMAVMTILAIHWNLCLGTISPYLAARPDLKSILMELERFTVNGQFMLTELDHGLDAKNLETTATLQTDGSFDLHTPSIGAAKVMPPSMCNVGVPRIAVVFAQLVVDGQNRGIRPFVVQLCTKEAMLAGVTCKLLPRRASVKPVVDHAITRFNHARLPSSALLGSLEMPEDPYKDFFQQISRVTIGAVSLSTVYIPALEVSAYICATHSLRRVVKDPRGGSELPIISFSTQHRPILAAFSLASVFRPFRGWIISEFMLPQANAKTKQNLACIFKATLTYSATPIMEELTDRLGWRGLISDNQILEMVMALRGASIAEGDALVLCIRFASELITGKCTLKPPRDPACPLARHEAGILAEARAKVASFAGTNHNSEFNSYILPRCKTIVMAIGHRMAYEAAVSSGQVSQELLKMFEAHCITQDSSWYVENTDLTREALFDLEKKAVDGMIPLVGELVEEIGERRGARAWVTSPIVGDDAWQAFLNRLPECSDPVSTGQARSSRL